MDVTSIYIYISIRCSLAYTTAHGGFQAIRRVDVEPSCAAAVRRQRGRGGRTGWRYAYYVRASGKFEYAFVTWIFMNRVWANRSVFNRCYQYGTTYIIRGDRGHHCGDRACCIRPGNGPTRNINAKYNSIYIQTNVITKRS